MSDTIKSYEFTGQVTNIDCFDNKIYVTVTKKLFDVYSEPNRIVVIKNNFEFWTKEPRDIYYAFTVFRAKAEGTFTIPREQLVNFWSEQE